MPLGIHAIFFVARGMFEPVMMGLFPIMESQITGRTRSHWQPNLVRPQVVVLVSNDADVLAAVPNVTVWNADVYRHSRRACDGRWR